MTSPGTNEPNKETVLQDRYVYPGTCVLKNKFDVKDANLLEQVETDFVSVRCYALSENPIKGKFDYEHLCAIHKHLFQDVYDWAGETRKCDLVKGEMMFCHWRFIESHAAELFKELAAEKYLKGLPHEAFCERAAYYLGEINALHPFREGNGRAQREFINQLAYNNGTYIEWERVSHEEMIAASIKSLKRDYSGLKKILQSNLKAYPSEISPVGACKTLKRKPGGFKP